MNNMKTVIGLALLAPVWAMGQATNAIPVAGESAGGTAPQWVLDLVGKYPWVATALLIVGALRLAVKPLFSALHTYAESTETKQDDEWLAKIENSRGLRWALYLLDWGASGKIIKPPSK